MSRERRRSHWRRRLLAAAAAVVVATVVLVAYAALYVPYRLDVEPLDVTLPRLGQEWEGERIAVLADLQVGMWGANTSTVEEAVQAAVDAEPAAVLVAGDLLYGRAQSPQAQTVEVVDLLRPLVAAGLPVIAVLGNHDHETGYAEELAARLETIGIEVLRNEATVVGPGSGLPPLYVVGIGSRRAGLDDAELALVDVPRDAPRIVLMHNPASFPALPPETAPIAFAGHTHCGQIRLPVGDGWSRLELRTDERYVIGGYSGDEYGAPGNRLFVTCGIGFSGVPLRLGATPQLVLAELHAP